MLPQYLTLHAVGYSTSEECLAGGGGDLSSHGGLVFYLI